MRGFIFIWWSCRPLFPEWIIPICLCWARFICRAVAESITSILHTILRIIQDRQHNSHSICMQMTAEEQCFQKQTADFCTGTCSLMSTSLWHRWTFKDSNSTSSSSAMGTCAYLHGLLVWLAISHVYMGSLMGSEMSPSTATIKVALQGMDREMREEYLVVIQAKDMGGHMGGLSGTTTVTITLTDINDNPPKFSKSE